MLLIFFNKFLMSLLISLCHTHENGNLSFSYFSLLDSHFRGNDRGKLAFVFHLLLFLTLRCTLYAIFTLRYTLPTISYSGFCLLNSDSLFPNYTLYAIRYTLVYFIASSLLLITSSTNPYSLDS